MELKQYKAVAGDKHHALKVRFFDNEMTPLRSDWDMWAYFPVDADISMDLPNMVPGGDSKKKLRVHYYGAESDFVFEYGMETRMSRYPACHVGQYDERSIRRMECKFAC